MSSQHPDAEPRTQSKKPAWAAWLRCGGWLVGALLTMVFGLVPFVLGVIVQAISPRRIPEVIVGLLAAAVFFALWWFAGWLPFVAGTGVPLWPSVVLSGVIFIPFFAAGVRLFCRLFPRRFSPASAAPQ